MADVARAAGVSTATVSRVLNSKDSVKPDLAERVQDAVRDLRYVPNSAGRALRRARSDMWAVIVPDAQNPFFTSFVNEFESVASKRNHSVVMCNSHEDHTRESQYIDAMLAQQVSGIVLAATSATRTSVQRLEEARIPLVLFDRLIRRFRGDSVTVDNFLAGKIAARHMVEQGVRRPIVLTGPKTVSSTVDRDAGYRSAFHDAGLAVSDEQVLRLDLTAETAAQELECALSAHPDTDGVFATNGPLTAAAFKSLQGLGWIMPERICFVGVDDEHWTRMVSPTVTVVSQPIDQLGRWAAKLLENRSQEPETDTVRIVLEPHLLVRDSSVRIVTAEK